MRFFSVRTAFNRVFKVIIWIVIFLFALAILGLSPLLFAWYVFQLFYKKKVGLALDKLAKQLRDINLVLDVLGNVTVFNWIDNYTDRHEYGNPDETISYVLFCRSKQGKLTNFDKLIYKLIILVDKDHFKVFE